MFSRGLVFGAQPETGAQPDVTTLYDRSRFKNNGTWVSGIWQQQPSRIWMSTGRYNITLSPSLTFSGIRPITVMAWGNPSSRAQYSGLICQQAEIMLTMFNVDYKPAFVLNSFATNDRAINPTAWDSGYLNKWWFLAGTYDGTNLKLFIQGNEAASVVPTGSYGDLVNNWSTGNNNNVTFLGSTGMFRVYEYALSAGQINKIFDSERRWFGV